MFIFESPTFRRKQIPILLLIALQPPFFLSLFWHASWKPQISSLNLRRSFLVTILFTLSILPLIPLHTLIAHLQADMHAYTYMNSEPLELLVCLAAFEGIYLLRRGIFLGML